MEIKKRGRPNQGGDVKIFTIILDDETRQLIDQARQAMASHIGLGESFITNKALVQYMAKCAIKN